MLIAFIFLSFESSTKKVTVLTGIYGVCQCEDMQANLRRIELILKEDYTFHYIDFSNPKDKIDVKGKWIQYRNKVVFYEYASKLSIRDKWTVNANGKCLLSRKGLNFVRYCHLESCQNE